MSRAIIYARVSTEEQGKENHYGLPSQIKECRRYAERTHLHVVEICQDEFTGTRLDRPGLERAIDLLSAGAADTLIVWAQDRLSRTLIGSSQILDQLYELGVEFHSVSQGGRIPLEQGGTLQTNLRPGRPGGAQAYC